MFTQVLARPIRAVFLLVLAALAASLAIIAAPKLSASPAHAATARPAFQAPVPCGEFWRTYTHDGHSDVDRLDMTWRDGGTEGKPVLASAAGTVIVAKWDDGGGGYYVKIDHGGSWYTQYLHLQAGSTIVSVGQTVARGQQIARAGATGGADGSHLHYDQMYGSSFEQVVFNGSAVPTTWYPSATVIQSQNCGGSTPPPAPSKYWVDTFANAPVFASATSTTQTGTLYAGTNYVYCKVWGRNVGNSTSFNHWWLKTDPDVGPANQYVSAYYLSRWGNDVAKDNNGVTIPNC